MKHTSDMVKVAPTIRDRRVQVTRWLSVAAASVFVAGCASAKNEVEVGGGSAGAAKTSMWGYVYAVNDRNDTVKVFDAQVRTEPVSDVVYTDSLGYWEIKEGVAETKYRFLAQTREKDGGPLPVTGQTDIISIEPGKPTKVDVILGAKQTAWPPTIKPDNKGVHLTGGIAIRR